MKLKAVEYVTLHDGSGPDPWPWATALEEELHNFDDGIILTFDSSYIFVRWIINYKTGESGVSLSELIEKPRTVEMSNHPQWRPLLNQDLLDISKIPGLKVDRAIILRFPDKPILITTGSISQDGTVEKMEDEILVGFNEEDFAEILKLTE